MDNASKYRLAVCTLEGTVYFYHISQELFQTEEILTDKPEKVQFLSEIDTMLDDLLGPEEDDIALAESKTQEIEKVGVLEIENHWKFPSGICHFKVINVQSQCLQTKLIVQNQILNLLSHLLESLSLPNYFDFMPKPLTCIFVSTFDGTLSQYQLQEYSHGEHYQAYEYGFEKIQ